MKRASNVFTLIEIMVVIVLIGFVATIGLPRLFHRPPSSEWKTIVEDINNLVLFARQEAISNQKNYRLKFKSISKGIDFVVVEEEKDDPEKPDHKIYERAYSPYFNTNYILSEYVKITGVYHGKNETMADNKNEGYCFVIPDGLVQDVLVHLTRRHEGEESKASFKMMPFLGGFEYFDGFVKPEK